MHNRKKGFTLVENFVALIVLGIVAASTIFGLVSARMWVESAKHHYQAINIARNRLEVIITSSSITAGQVAVTLDPATGLGAILTTTLIGTDAVNIAVSWTERMWGNISCQESITLILP